MKNEQESLRYLRLLAKDFPNVSSVTQEIINLEAIMHLPKSTEHFLADLHGENEAFQHVLRNASGYIKRKVHEIFDATLTSDEIKELCTLIYYPEESLKIINLPKIPGVRLHTRYFYASLWHIASFSSLLMCFSSHSRRKAEVLSGHAWVYTSASGPLPRVYFAPFPD